MHLRHCCDVRLPTGIETVPDGTVVELGCGSELVIVAAVVGDALELSHELDVAPDEAGRVVANAVLLAEGDHQLLRLAEVVPRETRPKVVLDLELQSAVEPVHPARARHIHGGLELHGEPLVRVIVVGATVVGVHVEVREADLHVEDACDGVRHEEEHQRDGPRGHGGAEGGEPDGEAKEGHHLELALRDSLAGEQQEPGLKIQVEARKSHDRVEREVLVADQEAGDEVVHLEELAVVRAEEALEHFLGDGEYGDVLDVGVVLDRVAHDVMHVV